MSRIAFVRDWFRRWLVRGNRPQRRPTPRARIRLEPLEDRRLLAVLYVDRDASGPGDGAGWATAFTDLQNALSAASSGTEIWVAEGTYKPTLGGNRNVSFNLKSGISVYGGFAGTETSLDQRNWTEHPTTLSGDIGLPISSADNSYHVVCAAGVTDARLDGFAVTGGNASASVGATSGGGMLNSAGSSPTIAHCVFFANSARYAGGGMANDASRPAIVDCAFRDNSAGMAGNGGGLYNYESAPSLVNVVFTGNVAVNGGAIYDCGGSPALVNVSLAGNRATGSGGALANFASPNGVASVPKLVNAIVWGNTALASAEIYDATGNSSAVTYSIIEGGHSGTGNLSDDPKFADVASGDLHLRADSPAIDAGTRSGAPGADLDGLARPQDGDGDLVAAVDIGAYEFPGNPPIPPTVTAITFSDQLLTDADVGNDLVITLAYSQPMDRSVLPTITLVGDTSGSLQTMNRTWTDDLHCRVTYDLIDKNTVASGIGVQVTGAKDSGGTSQAFYQSQLTFDIDTLHLVVLSIARPINTPPVTSAQSVQFIVTFNGTADGVDTKDFRARDASDSTIADVMDVFRADNVWVVTVGNIKADGNLWLDLIVDGSIHDSNGGLIEDFTSSEAYTIDWDWPNAVSFLKGDSDPTSAALLHFAITFSEPVTGVDATDFVIVAPNFPESRVESVVASGEAYVTNNVTYAEVYTVTVSRGAGTGTLQLNLMDDDSIRDSVYNRLGGIGWGNGYAVGPRYTIQANPRESVGLFDPNDSTFYLKLGNTSDSGITSFDFKTPSANATVLAGDWNGDGGTGVGLYDTTTSTFYLTDSYQSGYAQHTFAFGAAGKGWIPLVGDWDGDGAAGVGLYDPHASTFYLTNALKTGYAQYTFGFGMPGAGWKPLVGDWNGDGHAGVGLYSSDASTFFLTDTLQTGVAEHTFGFGLAGGGWQTLVGDWDGDGQVGVGLYAPASSTFYLTDSLLGGYAEYTFGYGVPGAGWKPMVGDWNADGASGVGLFAPASSTFYLSDRLTTGSAEHTFGFGTPGAGWQPLVGSWTSDAQASASVATPAELSAAAIDEIDLSGIAAEALQPGPLI